MCYVKEIDMTMHMIINKDDDIHLCIPESDMYRMGTGVLNSQMSAFLSSEVLMNCLPPSKNVTVLHGSRW